MTEIKSSRLFIIGSERSGTNLLRSLLGNHPAICAPQPIHFCNQIGPYFKSINLIEEQQRPQLFIDEILQFLNVDSFPLTVPHSNESKSPQIKIETFPFEFTTLLKNHFLEKNRALEILLHPEIRTWKQLNLQTAQ